MRYILAQPRGLEPAPRFSSCFFFDKKKTLQPRMFFTYFQHLKKNRNNLPLFPCILHSFFFFFSFLFRGDEIISLNEQFCNKMRTHLRSIEKATTAFPLYHWSVLALLLQTFIINALRKLCRGILQQKHQHTPGILRKLK